MKNYYKKFSILFAICFVTITNSQITVDNTPGVTADFSDLQEAIDQSDGNQTIYVHSSSISYGNITLNKPFTIIGKSHTTTIIDNLTITAEGSNSIIKGFFVDNNITMRGSDVTSSNKEKLVNNILIENCFINDDVSFRSIRSATNSLSTGSANIFLIGNVMRYIGRYGSYLTNLTISNNLIQGQISTRNFGETNIKNNIFFSSNNPISTSGSDKRFTIQNSIFLTKSVSAVTLNISNVSLENCLTYNYGSGNYNLPNNLDNFNVVTSGMLLNTDPKFTIINTEANSLFSLGNDYSLQDDSPAKNAGVNSEDLGLFNNYNFTNEGFPTGYPTVNITSSSPTISENGQLKVIISAKSN